MFMKNKKLIGLRCCETFQFTKLRLTNSWKYDKNNGRSYADK